MVRKAEKLKPKKFSFRTIVLFIQQSAGMPVQRKFSAIRLLIFQPITNTKLFCDMLNLESGCAIKYKIGNHKMKDMRFSILLNHQKLDGQHTCAKT